MSAIRKESFDYDISSKDKKYYQNKKRINNKKRNKIFIDSFKSTAMICIVFVLGIVTIYNYSLIIDKKQKINELNMEIEKLSKDIEKYSVALDSLKSSNDIEFIAKSKLGMDYPTRDQTVFMDFKYEKTYEYIKQEQDTTKEEKTLISSLLKWLENFKI